MFFTKYSCQGNDFVLYNSLSAADELKFSTQQVEYLCDRKMGIGADGVLVLKDSTKADYRMVYYNADGHEVEMCGNGARACVHAFTLIKKLAPETKIKFETMNGLYGGCLHKNNEVSVSMNEVGEIDLEKTSDLNGYMQAKASFFIKVGVPHVLFEVVDVQGFELQKYAPKVRWDKRFPAGINVSVFSFISNEEIQLRTFERGVEGETLACGTAATAIACVAKKKYQRSLPQQVNVAGGVLEIGFEEGNYQLKGRVSEVFQANLSKASQAYLRELE
jgi:diaminopimelate epimerase